MVNGKSRYLLQFRILNKAGLSRSSESWTSCWEICTGINIKKSVWARVHIYRKLNHIWIWETTAFTSTSIQKCEQNSNPRLLISLSSNCEIISICYYRMKLINRSYYHFGRVIEHLWKRDDASNRSIHQKRIVHWIRLYTNLIQSFKLVSDFLSLNRSLLTCFLTRPKLKKAKNTKSTLNSI